MRDLNESRLGPGSTEDSIIPFSQSLTLFDAIPTPKMFVRFEGADHNTPLPDDFPERILAFLEYRTEQ